MYKYVGFANMMGMKQQKERIYMDGLGNVNTFVSMPSVSVLKADQHISKSEIVEKELSESEKGALMRYIGSDSYLLNDKLRRGAKLSNTEKTWILELDSALEKLPNYEGDVIRVVEFAFQEDLNKFISEFEVGKINMSNQYLSSSKKEGYNENAQVIIYIKSKTGKDISLYNPEESEVLFERNVYFTCSDKKKKMIITMFGWRKNMMSDYEIPKYKNRRDWMLHEPIEFRTVKYTQMTMNQRIRLRKRQKRLLKDGKITQEEYENLIKEYPLPEDAEDTTIID